MAEYLLEIGTEEIPARFIENTLEQMRDLVAEALDGRRILYDTVRAQGTPRRLALRIGGLALQGEDLVEEVRGPAQKAAYDSEGKPTKALTGFAGAQGVGTDSLFVKEMNGNAYIYARRQRKGQSTAEVLPTLLADMVSALSFPKFMRWGDLDFKFVRPIRWVVSLLDGEILPLTLANVSAGRESRGHRYLSRGVFTLDAAGDYENALEREYVIVDPDRRKAMIGEKIEQIAEQNGCLVPPDEELLAEVTFLLEWPTALMGSFHEGYLEIPEEAVITPMREHQRYFPVRDREGKLMNRFVTLRDGGDRMLDLVTEGNEKVLAARLSDARFFWDEDRKQPLEDYLPKLERVVFQEKLGTVGDKIRRIEGLTAWLAVSLHADADTKATALRAARLAKADLATSMVYEFAELQGIMGRHYALACGEKPEVAQAVLEHYRPRFAGDPPAASAAGAFVAIADKADTIAGIFAIGIEPSGSQDPYALRRAAMGVCQTILAHDLPVDLGSLVHQALGQYTYVLADEDGALRVHARIMEFLGARIRAVLSDEGHRYDVVDCVMSVPYTRIQEVRERAQAVSALRGHADFAALLAGFTRAYNLTKKSDESMSGAAQATTGPDGAAQAASGSDGAATMQGASGASVGATALVAVDPALFTEEAEMALHARLLATRAAIGGVLREQGQSAAILALANLAEPVNAFFDGVMVMAEDPAIRANRLGLLREVVSLTLLAGDLSKLQD